MALFDAGGIAAGDESLLADLGDVENRLVAAENKIAEALWQSTDPEEIEIMLKSARTELQRYEATMNPEVYKDTLRRHVTARLRERYGIPRLSLFYL